VEVVASLAQGRTAAAQCGLFTHKSVPVIFEPACTLLCFFLFRGGLTFLSSAPHLTPPSRHLCIKCLTLWFLKNGIPTNKLTSPVYRVLGRMVRP